MKKKYNRKGNARERYEAEYHESRMFNAYLNSDWDFNGDTAKLNAYRSWQMRFIPSFIRKLNFKGVGYFVIEDKNGREYVR